MRSPRCPIVGDRFGLLVVLRIVPGGRYRRAVVTCDCGAARSVRVGHLNSGATQSCGCQGRARALASRTKHRGAGTPEYHAWNGMKQRCMNQRNKAWAHYGGRGIVVCAEWLDDFAAFLGHIGPRPSPLHSVDRIDFRGNYEPGNVRWATADVQSQNRRTTRFVEFSGERLPLTVWARRIGITARAISLRLEAGWPLARALTAPKKVAA